MFLKKLRSKIKNISQPPVSNAQSSHNIRIEQLVLVTGFARGGTSWLRDCIASHPEIAKISHELVFGHDDVRNRESMERKIFGHFSKQEIGEANFYVNKAPANAPRLKELCSNFPEIKFIFIIRDPRDVFVSHKRGDKEWMSGKNSEISGCMGKIQKYYAGYLRAKEFSNLLLVSYEELHQNFHETMSRIYDFIGVSVEKGELKNIFKANNFARVTGRKNIEDRSSAKRKGVVGDWGRYLDQQEKDWYSNNQYWKKFLIDHNYRLTPLYYRNILAAMKAGGIKSLSENDILNLNLDTKHPNLILLHDVDLLNSGTAIDGVIESAKILGEADIFGIFNFLPLDDWRYATRKPEDIAKLVQRIRSLAPKASIGLHLNATEKFFKAKDPDFGDNHPKIKEAVNYLHCQIDEYERIGINFNLATAHGYGRGKKLPNNRDSLIFTEELKKRNIALFDTAVRPLIDSKANSVIKLTDVGGAMSVRHLYEKGELDDPSTYKHLQPGSLIRCLIHPGNYDITKPLTLSARIY